MEAKVEVRQVDEGLGIILPEAMLNQLGAKKGDHLYVVRVANGYLLTRSEDDARAMDVYERGSKRYANALRQLAES